MAAPTEAAVAASALSPGEVAASSVGGSSLVDAVASALAAAELPINLEQKQLLERNLDLQRRLDHTIAELAAATDENRSAARQLDELKAAHTCAICLTRRVDTLLEPCGHLMCRLCVGGCAARCPFCRSSIEATHHFYGGV